MNEGDDNSCRSDSLHLKIPSTTIKNDDRKRASFVLEERVSTDGINLMDFPNPNPNPNPSYFQ